MAAKQTKTDDEKLLEALRTVLMATGLPLQKSGRNPGIFPGGKAGVQTAEIALQRGFLIEVPNEAPARGRKKPAPHYRISAEEQAFVLQHDSPKQALEAINVAIQQLARELPGVVNEPEQANGFASVVEELTNHLASVRTSIQEVAERIRRALERFSELAQDEGYRIGINCGAEAQTLSLTSPIGAGLDRPCGRPPYVRRYRIPVPPTIFLPILKL